MYRQGPDPPSPNSTFPRMPFPSSSFPVSFGCVARTKIIAYVKNGISTLSKRGGLTGGGTEKETGFPRQRGISSSVVTHGG